MSWRPDNWEIPLEHTSPLEFSNEAYEAGADAMLEARDKYIIDWLVELGFKDIANALLADIHDMEPDQE